MPQHLILGLVVTLIFGGAIGYFFGYDHGFERGEVESISSFEECAAAGYPIMESYPEQCATPDGKHFVREIPEEENADSDDSVPEEPAPTPPVQGGGNVETGPIACPMDARMCPDGSYVGRTGPNCEFAPCP